MRTIDSDIAVYLVCNEQILPLHCAVGNFCPHGCANLVVISVYHGRIKMAITYIDGIFHSLLCFSWLCLFRYKQPFRNYSQ